MLTLLKVIFDFINWFYIRQNKIILKIFRNLFIFIIEWNIFFHDMMVANINEKLEQAVAKLREASPMRRVAREARSSRPLLQSISIEDN